MVAKSWVQFVEVTEAFSAGDIFVKHKYHHVWSYCFAVTA